MSRAAIAGIVAAALVGGAVLGIGGTAATMWIGGALMHTRGPIAAGPGFARAQAPGLDGSGPAWSQGQGGMRGGMMGGRQGAAPGRGQGQGLGDPDGAGPLACPQCGYESSGAPVPYRR